MTDAMNGFGTRLKSLQRKHAKMARGYECKVGRDGLIVFRPKRRRPGVPWRGIALLVLGFLCFKGLVLAHMGPEGYAERVNEMRRGGAVEQAGAIVMQVDPVADFVARQLAPHI
ncbi:hypothetical protein K1T73_03260 [Roseovarius sp. SCSIO 43702]|uniref:hypothetical protein n=1 Tax=Roseovarius sp. SCSIO 43702 TaxID=2823043 RepID=UPI001C72A947|nr:hypothetical protein [Roseovarius sp. SCSIO 43702]QYX57434.1 hypothetical protein K1T73_03260 [Roseovarius sp. SCSIO 43702]